LYVSVDASTKDGLKKIDRPLFRDFWDRFIGSFQALSDKVGDCGCVLPLVLLWIGQTGEQSEQLMSSPDGEPSHILYYLLPRQTEYSYSLWSRSHNLELSHIHDNRNFTDRMMFLPYRIV